MNLALSLFRMKNNIFGRVLPGRAAKSASKYFLRPRRFPPKAWELEMESHGTRQDIGGGISAIFWGDSERKILLVHGWESRATQMSGFVESLLALNYQVIAIDAPAHGHSTGKKSNPYLFSRAVYDVCKKLGPFEGIVGHSIGGNAVATATASNLYVPKIVLISSPSSIEAVLKGFCQFVHLPHRSTALFMHIIERAVGKPTSILNTADNMRNSTSTGLIIHDKADLEIPFSESLLISKAWSSASHFSTNGYGHRAVLRQPEVWQKVAQFFSE